MPDVSYTTHVRAKPQRTPYICTKLFVLDGRCGGGVVVSTHNLTDLSLNPLVSLEPFSCGVCMFSPSLQVFQLPPIQRHAISPSAEPTVH